MGEQSSLSSSNPVYIVIMRNSRGKLFVYVAVIGVLCFIVFLLSSTHNRLKDLEGVNDKCQQQRDSLSAQLQVVYEHKNRLEKSLQQEKTDHKHTKEANEKQVSEIENKFQKEKDEKQKLESQLARLKSSYNDLEEEKTQSENVLHAQLKTVQSQKDAEIEKLQTHISELLSEKDKLEVSNNAFAWKLEQHSSELKLCHLQFEQAKSELHTCQEQQKMHNANMVDHLSPKAAFPEKNIKEDPPINSPKPYALHQHLEDNLKQNQGLPLMYHVAKELDAGVANKTASPLPEKPASLAKPHIMPAGNLGDGVLPKPVDMKPEIFNKDLDAAIEISDLKSVKPMLPEQPLLNRIEDRDVDFRANLINGDAKANAAAVLKDQESHPQVVPPNLENNDDKDDHAGERGEDGNQYNPDAKPQVEEPVLGRQSYLHKEVLPVQGNNDIGVQMQQMNDMMNKSPGDVNNLPEQNVLGVPPRLGQKHPEYKNGGPILHRGAEVPRVIDDKNYEEDDDDRENDDEPPNGLAHAMKGVNNILQDNDFDDQDNVDNAKEEEGVVVAPK